MSWDVVQDVSIKITSGKLILIRGRSGSGKTTLLILIAGLDEPSKGDIFMGNIPLAQLSTHQIVELRRKEIGFIFQKFRLLPFLSVEENVEVPLHLVRTPQKERKSRVEEALPMAGLSKRARHRTYELSGGSSNIPHHPTPDQQE